MCENCVATTVETGKVVHLGYDESGGDPYDRLMDGDLVVETGDGPKRIEQADWLEARDTLQPPGGEPAGPEEMGCAECGRGLTCVPGIEAECERCGCSKHDRITELSENRERVRAQMEEYERTVAPFGPGKGADPIELAIRAGLQCPSGHWVCADCLVFGGGD